jgi:hypothetical protein
VIVNSSIILHPGQERIVKEVLTNPVKYNSINASRQAGKSVLGREFVNFFAFNYKEFEKAILKPKFLTEKCKIFWISPTIPQARKVYKEFENAWAPILRYRNKTERTLITQNGTTLQFFGVDKADNIRGENCNYMVLDEYAFYKDDVFNTVLRPMLNVTGKMAIFISTPNGLNDFYQLKIKGESLEYPNYKYSYMTYKENPYYSIEEVEDAKQMLPDPIFRQEYLAEFVGGGANVFGNFERLMILDKWSEPISTMEYYNGNDIAKQKDWTVSTTIDKNQKVSHMLRIRQMNWQDIIDAIVNDLTRYNPYSLMEVNGVGDPVFDLVRNKFDQIQPFVTTNQSKQMIIQNLIAACNIGALKLPSKELCPSLHEQLNMFTFDYSPEKRQIVYKAREGYHDDDVISLALANMQHRRFNGLDN